MTTQTSALYDVDIQYKSDEGVAHSPAEQTNSYSDHQLLHGEYSRDGNDLIIQTEHESVTVDNYFAQDFPPTLTGENVRISENMVQSFLKSTPDYADAGSSTDESPVGRITEITGDVTITHVDGSVEKATNGTPIFENDIIETSADGAANIVFVDDSSFAVSDNARLAIDAYVFDPETNEGATDFSMLKGLFVYTSGLIGREDPDDVTIDTPMGSIGIRGTIIAGDVDSGEITVVEGAIVLRDMNGNEMTLANQLETAKFSGTLIEGLGQRTAQDMMHKFENVSDVSGDLFSSIQDGAGETGKNRPEIQDYKGNDAEILEQKDGRNPEGEKQDHQNHNDVDKAGDQTNLEIRNDTMHDQLMQGNNPSLNRMNPSLTRQAHVESILHQAMAKNGQDIKGLGDLKHKFAFDDDKPIFKSFKNSEHFLGAQSVAGDGGDASNTAPQLVGGGTQLAVPADYFKSTVGTTFTYDFSQEFFDADGDVLTYELDDDASSTLDNLVLLEFISPSYSLNTNTGILSFHTTANFNSSLLTLEIIANDETGSSSVSTSFSFVNTSPLNATNSASGHILSLSLKEGLSDHSLAADNKKVFLADGLDDVFEVSGDNNVIYMHEAQNAAGTSGRIVDIQDDAQNTTIYGGSQDDIIKVEEAVGLRIYTTGGNDIVELNLDTITQSDLNSAVIDLGRERGLSWAEAVHKNIASTLGITASDGDTLKINGDGQAIDFSTINNIKNIETLDAKNGTIETLTLSADDIFKMTDDKNTLIFKSDSDDIVNIRGLGTSIQKTSDILINTDGVPGEELYDIYTGQDSSGHDVTILIENVVQVNGIA